MEHKKVGLLLGTCLSLWVVFSFVVSAVSQMHGRYTSCEFAMAIGNEDLPRIRHLLEQGADPNTDVFQFGSDAACSGQMWTASSSTSRMPALLYALHPKMTMNDIGSTKIARLLLDANANVNALDESSNTPLIVAAYAGNVEIVKLLLAKGAEVQAINDRGQSH